MSKVEDALIKKFQEYRVIFWYDEKKELFEQFTELNIDGVEKIHVANNEFRVKYKIIKAHPTRKFLLYFSIKKPSNETNWLLDLELAYHLFHTDQEALFLQDIGLGYHLKELVTEHIEFFKSKERRLKLKELIGVDDKHEDIRSKMLAVVFNTEYVGLNTFIHAHSTAYIDDNTKCDRDLERFKLKSYYWGKIKYKFNYDAETPTIYDFLLEIFNHSFALGHTSQLTKESRLVIALWKDTIQYRDSFGAVSDKISEDIDVESKLQHTEIEQIINDDLFRLVDKKIIHALVDDIVNDTISYEKVLQFKKQRENKFWYKQSEALYNSIEYGAETISLIRKYNKAKYSNFNDGVENYATNLYRVDLAYRKFVSSFRQAKQNRILSKLIDKIEKVYANDWLLKFNNNWQNVIDDLKEWPTKEMYSQQQFFTQHVNPFIQKNQRLFVIISDALRYENGVELSKKLQSENRYESSHNFMVSSLPCYTQLGMASLLPHKKISLKEPTDTVIIDGMSSLGTKGRSKILATNSGVRATAIQAEDFMNMNANKEGRAFVKEYDLIYIYHNRIDKTGDDKATEERLFDAVEQELSFLMDVIKKIANMNGNNMLITSDHGYVYQYSDLDESDFLTTRHSGDIWKENRRFVIGEDLKGDDTTKAFKGSELNIDSNVNVLIPKSVNRLRISGAGSRFVHGGATMQEIVIPLIKVSKKRQDTTTQVDIDIIKSTDRITTNILAVSFIQSNLVESQVLPRTIRAGIYTENKELLSDVFTYNFDIKMGSERQREVKHRFQLMSKASGKYKNQRVQLVLEEPVEGTTKWKVYKNYFYTLNISFTNDFDDF